MVPRLRRTLLYPDCRHGLCLCLLLHVLWAGTVDECCRTSGVPESCVQTLCFPLNPPGDFAIYDIFQKKNNCSKHLPQIAECLSDGRDHSACCRAEAKDRDETACFGLCEGSGNSGKGLKPYQTCLAINLASMFGCLQRGYEQSPSRARNVRSKAVDTTTATIAWDEPEQNADRVANYLLYMQEQLEDTPNNASFVKGLEPKEVQLQVDGTEVSINDLEPGTAYKVTVIAVGQQADQKSLPTHTVTVHTAGVAPRVHAYRDVVHAPVDAPSVVLACSVHMSSISRDSTTKFQWYHKAPGGALKPLSESGRHNTSYYVFSYERPREYVSTLEIHELKPSDFGLYQCGVADKYGTAEAEVQLALSASTNQMADRPPDTPLQCCRGRGVEQRCLQMCGAGHENADNKRYVPRPFMPTNCSGQISKVLSCAMPGVNDGACCLREHVPRACMYLCDSSIAPTNHMDPQCVQHMASVEKCRVRGVQRRPHTPQPKAQAAPGVPDQVSVSWAPAPHAQAYHLYWRRRGQEDWQRKMLQDSLQAQLSGAHELVLVAANTFGLSQPARLSLQDERWAKA